MTFGSLDADTNLTTLLSSFQRNQPSTKHITPISTTNSDVRIITEMNSNQNQNQNQQITKKKNHNDSDSLRSSTSLSMNSITMSNTSLLMHDLPKITEHPYKCKNCGSYESKLWRRLSTGEVLCNGCGLYYKLLGVVKKLPSDNDIKDNDIDDTNVEKRNNLKPMKRKLNALLSNDQITPKQEPESLFTYKSNRSFELEDDQIPKVNPLFTHYQPSNLKQTASTPPSLFPTSSRSSTSTENSFEETDTIIDQILVALEDDEPKKSINFNVPIKENSQKSNVQILNSQLDQDINTFQSNINIDMFNLNGMDQSFNNINEVDDEYDWLKMSL